MRRSSTKRRVRQLGDDGAVDGGLEVELEVGQALGERVVGEAQPAGQAPGGGGLDLGRQEPLEDLHRRRAASAVARSSSAARLLGRGGQAEVGEMLARAGIGGGDPRLGGPAHRDELGVDRQRPDLDGLADGSGRCAARTGVGTGARVASRPSSAGDAGGGPTGISKAAPRPRPRPTIRSGGPVPTGGDDLERPAAGLPRRSRRGWAARAATWPASQARKSSLTSRMTRSTLPLVLAR